MSPERAPAGFLSTGRESPLHPKADLGSPSSLLPQADGQSLAIPGKAIPEIPSPLLHSGIHWTQTQLCAHLDKLPELF